MKSRSLLSSLVMGTVFILGVGVTVHAQNRNSCPDTIRQDQRDLDKAVDRYGYDSPQAQHERDELQRDAANCGYTEYGSQNQYYRRDREDQRYQGNDAYRDGYRDYDRRGDRYDPAYENGYRDGLNIGQQDARKRKSFRPQKHDEFEDGDRGYNRSYGDKGQYKNMYRQGFQNGYSEGYGR
ncbi:MAG TPA: hypothetical protein VFE02_01655 [Candidatus Acidoferrales bacterium]|nr:hypothetical protein [Candidatus Acidoferrales bacterium]